MNNINTILIERKNNYGSFKDNANITQGMIDICNKYYNYKDFKDVCIKETIHMISHKIARAICGDYFYKDTYIDIIGYAKICIDELNNDNYNSFTADEFIECTTFYNNLNNDIKIIINKHYHKVTSFDVFNKLYSILCILPLLIDSNKEIKVLLLIEIINITEIILKEYFNES